MRIRYDREADILYIFSKGGSVKDTVEIADDIFIELDEENKILGIEIWQVRKNLFPEILRYIEEIKTKNVLES